MIQENEHNKKQDEVQEKKQKKKLSLLKKKIKSPLWSQLYQNVDIKHVLNINDMVFINENALKDPENKQSLLSAVFYYKMISKVALNEDNIVITLKKLDENALPPQYYLERLRSYGDRKYYNIANYLQNLKRQFENIHDIEKFQDKKQIFTFDEQLKILQKSCQQRKGKMYLIFFSEIHPSGVMMKKIILSTALLKQLGYNVNEIALDFIKYKHVFFEIFTAKMYSTMIQNSLSRYSQLTSTLMEKQYSLQQMEQLNTMIYQDEMIRRKKVNGSYQEDILSVKVKWTSPHPSVGIFTIEDVQELNVPYTGNKKIKKLQLPDIQGELKSLQHLTKIDPSLLEENKNRCCTFKIIGLEQQNENAEKQ